MVDSTVDDSDADETGNFHKVMRPGGVGAADWCAGPLVVVRRPSQAWCCNYLMTKQTRTTFQRTTTRILGSFAVMRRGLLLETALSQPSAPQRHSSCPLQITKGQYAASDDVFANVALEDGWSSGQLNEKSRQVCCASPAKLDTPAATTMARSMAQSSKARSTNSLSPRTLSCGNAMVSSLWSTRCCMSRAA